MVYRLAEKRCGNFGTCVTVAGTTTPISQVNNELFKAGGLFAQGRDLLHAGTCSGVRPVVDQIVSLMTVPLVQGTLRYAWKVGQTGGVDNKLADQSAKNAAEGSTFAAAVLPLVHACDAAAAKVVSDNMKFGAAVYTATTAESDSEYTSGTKPDTGAVKAALEKTYTCLGITCAHVGGLLNSAKTAAEAGMETCTDPTAAAADTTKITGDKKNQVSVQVKAAGDVSDYDATKKAAVEAAMAKVAGVAANAVTVTVKAGSVILDFVIITADPAAAAAVKATVATALKDKTLASTALGVTVTAVPTVAVVAVPKAKTDSDDGLSTGAMVGIAVGAVVGLLLIGGVIFMVMKSGKNVNPKEHSPA